MRKTVRHQRGMVSAIRMESLSAIAGIRNFVLREDDPGYSKDSDNVLASRELFIHACADTDAEEWKFIGCDWPDGYVNDPMPHGLLFHDLRHDVSTFGTSPPQNLSDIQRIGDVWVDLIVRFQYYYDVVQSKWVKAFHTKAEDNVRVYAQEPSIGEEHAI